MASSTIPKDDTVPVDNATRDKGQNLVWRCLTCGTAKEPTRSGYMKLIAHKCSGKMRIRLIDTATDEELGSNLNQDRVRELMGEQPGGGESGLPFVMPDGLVRYTIQLPAQAFALHALVNEHHLERDGQRIDFDPWVWNMISLGFPYIYKKQMVLVDVKGMTEKEASGVTSSG